jgi:RNA polymerase sigma factor (sigma-70 family)
MLSGSNTISVDTNFWEKAFADNFASLCSRASRRLTNGNSYEAEDVVSEAYVRVMRYAQDPDSIKNVVSYLWRAVTNVWKTEQVLLRHTRTQSLEDMEAEEIEGLAGIQVEPEVMVLLRNEEAHQELRMKLGPMTLEESRIIELLSDGYTFKEISDQLGTNLSQTRFLWHRFVVRQRSRQGDGHTPHSGNYPRPF